MFAFSVVSAQSEAETPIWQAGNTIHDRLFAAQQALLAGGSDAAAKATAAIDEADTLYAQSIQPSLKVSAADADSSVSTAFAEARTAAAKADGPTFAYAGGALWTALLRGSSDAALSALKAGDSEAASDWLRLREYRSATKYSVVDDPAAQAIARLQGGGGNLDEVSVTVSNDLRDTYTFRLRDALDKLKDAAAQNFAVRSADWSARVGGYFGILQGDFTAKRGQAETDTVLKQLAALRTAALGGDLTAAATLSDSLKTALSNYQPIELTSEEVAKRAQLLYMFIDLVQVEYGRGVQDGQITLPIEVQEAVTFRTQSSALYEELRPIMSANDPAATDQLGAQLTQIKTMMTAVDSHDRVKQATDASLGLAKQALRIEPNLTDVSAAFTVVDSMLKDMRASVLAGDYEAAESKRLQAYGTLDVSIEQRLRGFAPDMAAEVESLFWQGTPDQAGFAVLLAERAPVAEVQTAYNRLNTALADAQNALNIGKSAPEAIVGNAAIIVFREGLEAVLILASLLGGMRAAEQRQYRRSLAVGSGLALLGAVITWVIFSSILSSLISLGERLEAITSIVAIAVLLLITNWFFHKTYWTGWMANFHTQKGKILSGAAIVGPSLGLVLLGFTSVYREVFETVLFLQSLVLDAGAEIVLRGVGIGLLLTVVVGFLTFKLQMRLPYKRMLVFTGILIGAVLFTMVGNTIHVMQVVGWMPITPVSGLYLPYWLGRWFGVFATWQGLIAQVASAAFVLGSYFLAERQNHRKRDTAQTKRATQGMQAAAPGSNPTSGAREVKDAL